MKEKCLIICIVCVFFGIFLSCTTSPVREKNTLFIMVYDYESNEVNGVEIYLNGKKCGQTDIYGRFILPISKNTSGDLVFKKDRYEIIKVILEDSTREFLYIKMGSAYYYAQMSEKLLDQKKYDEALKNIEKALIIEARKDYEYLKSVIVGERKRWEKIK